MKINYKIWSMACSKVSRKELEYIAKADYGFDFELNLNELEKIHKTWQLPSNLEWNPLEVLSLIRWADYKKHPDEKASVLFSVLIIILAFHSDSGDVHSCNESIIIAIDICNILGENWLNPLKKMFEDLYSNADRVNYDDELLYLPLGIWVISNLLVQDDEIRKWKVITDNETKNLIRNDFSDPKESALYYSCFDQKKKVWNTYLNQFNWTDLDVNYLWELKYT